MRARGALLQGCHVEELCCIIPNSEQGDVGVCISMCVPFQLYIQLAALMLPGYPAIPITAFISSALLLLVLITSIERRSWNFGLTILCFSVFIENFFGAIETIIWRNDAEIRLHAFCDFSQSVDTLWVNEITEVAQSADGRCLPRS